MKKFDCTSGGQTGIELFYRLIAGKFHKKAFEQYKIELFLSVIFRTCPVWQAIQYDYRTLIGVDVLTNDVKKSTKKQKGAKDA